MAVRWDKPDEFDKLEVGREYYNLTCTSIRPTVFRCRCGKEVRRRSLTHLNDGMRSCGCLQKQVAVPRLRNEADFKEAARLRRVRLLSVIGADMKARHRSYRVECLDCGKVHDLSHERFVSQKPALGGCQSCSAKVAMRQRSERRERWLGPA